MILSFSRGVSSKSVLVNIIRISLIPKPIRDLKCSSDCFDHPCIESIQNSTPFTFENPAIVFLK